MGGGGYGDPIDRDPARVLEDVARGLVTTDAAREVYGVVVDGAAARVDEASTAARRREIRSLRVGSPYEGRLERTEVPPTGRRLGEYLQQTTAGATQCTWCGATIAPADARWKEHAVLRRSPLRAAGAHRAEDGGFVLVEACCPACGTLLDTDVALGEDPPLHDRVVRWPDE
jgi:N-methylhydantoinase B